MKALSEKRFFLLDQERQKTKDPQRNTEIVLKMIELLKAERDNAESTIPLVEYDSVLGFEPSMEYTGDKKRILWKINQVDEEIKMLESLI